VAGHPVALEDGQVGADRGDPKARLTTGSADVLKERLAT
jgi:hypothetical protein